MKTIIWVHGDNLNLQQMAFKTAPDAPSVFVWDEALVEEWQLSFKRIVFIYECLLELPVVIRKGDVADEVAAFALEHGANIILTATSPSPRHHLICQGIASKMPKGSRLEVLHDPSLVSTEDNFDVSRYSRYSRYWNVIKWDAMKPTKE